MQALCEPRRAAGTHAAQPELSTLDAVQGMYGIMCLPSGYRAAPFSLTTLVTFLVINHLLPTQLDSSMSLDVFLSFSVQDDRRCPKHPNTPRFDCTPIPLIWQPAPGEIGGD